MSEAVLDLVLRARSQGTAALAAVSKELGGLGSASKGAAKDAEKLASADGKGGALGGIGSALGMMGGPLGVVTAGIGAMVAVGGAAYDTYKTDEVSIKSLDAALTTHGLNVQTVTAAIEANSAQYENLGYTIEQVRPAFTQLTEAGLNQQQQMAAMGPIMDLARAKNIDLGTAATAYTMAVMGNARAVKQYGILLPPVAASAANVTLATSKLTAAHQAATLAEEQLTVVEDGLKGKHTLTAAEALKLQQAHIKVTDSEGKLKAAEAALTLAQQGGIDKGARLTLVNNALHKAIAGQSTAIDANAPIMAKLSDDWEHFAEAVGPGVETAFGIMLQGVEALFGFIGGAIGGLETFIGDLGKLFGAVNDIIGALGRLPGVSTIRDLLTAHHAATTIGALHPAGGGGGLSAMAAAGMANTTGLAGGGMVPGRPGQPMPILAHGGEMVGTPGAPLSGGGAMFAAGAIIVNGANDPAATAAAVMLEIKRQLTVQGTSFSSGY